MEQTEMSSKPSGAECEESIAIHQKEYQQSKESEESRTIPILERGRRRTRHNVKTQATESQRSPEKPCEKRCRLATLRLQKARLRAKETLEDRERRQSSDRKRQARQRTQETHEDTECRRSSNRLQQARKRAQETHEDTERRQSSDRNRQARQRAQETHEDTEHRQSSDRKRQARQRAQETHEDTEHRQSSDRKRQARQRAQETHEDTEHRQSSDRKRQARQRAQETHEDTEHRQSSDRKRQARQRAQETSPDREQRLTTDKTRTNAARQRSSNERDCILAFQRAICNGPVYICVSCNRLLYRTSVSKFSLLNVSGTGPELLSGCVSSCVSPDGQSYICTSCSSSLKKKQIPVLCSANGLGLEEIPQILRDMIPLECVFLSRRIPFMKLLGLPRGKQSAIHGTVVNVPINTEQCVNILPRVPTPDYLVSVKLKRKLEYHGHAYFQNIRPHKIMQALQTIKLILKNPLYSDVVINEQWERDSADADQEFWDTLTVPVDDQLESDSDSDEGNENEGEDERSKYSGVPLDSCMQPIDFTDEARPLLEFAPGEGRTPLPYSSDENSEQLSFPQLFPTGKFGFNTQRTKKLSMKKYFRARLLHHDGRFARTVEYLFYAQYRCEAKDVYDCLTFSTRKGASSQNMTAGAIKTNINNFLSTDLGVHFLQKVRGSPAYFHKMLLDLLGMIRQLGPCTWFITLSAADLKWPDLIGVLAQQQGRVLSDDQIKSLSWQERCDLLRANPITAARHFDQRVQLFFRHILLNKKLNPLGDIIDFKYRIEFQQRGSPHVHMLAWVKDAPTFENSSEEEVTAFVTKHITCSLPENDDDLKSLLQQVQSHHHSRACKKHGDKCRFHFPRPPWTATTAVKPPETAHSEADVKTYTATLQKVQDALKTTETSQLDKMTVEDLLLQAGVGKEVYTQAVVWAHTKQGQPAILLKRSPSEIFVNNYNPTAMRSWRANIDVQYVTNVYSCIMYVASYISKPEKTLGDLLKAVSTSGQHLSRRQAMLNVSKQFLSHREVSAQEAAYRILGLPLTKTSRQVLFLPTNMPEDRTRLVKSIELLQQLEDEDEDIFYKNILDRYAARPVLIEAVCLAEFASNYTYTSVAGDVEVYDECLHVNDNSLPQRIKLLDEMGYMKKRKNPALIRTHQFSKTKQAEEYSHAQLLLYLPWRNEVDDLCQPTYQDKYESVLTTIKGIRAQFEHHADEVDDAMDQLQTVGANEDSWIDIASENVQQSADDSTVERENQSLFDVPVSEQNLQASSDTGCVPLTYSLLLEHMDSNQYLQMVMSLNEEQKQIHDFIMQWCFKQSVSHRTAPPSPFHIFMTGGAGVGKSHVVRTIVQTASRCLGKQAHDRPILVCAPTGAAAYNISGHTLHSAFLLPIVQGHQDDYIRLSNEKLTSVREKIGNLQILVIDEISMVGADMLLTIHRRLCDIKGSQEPFGGVSVLAVGDLLQLPPVAQRPVYLPPSDEVAAIYGSLWQTHFSMVELTTIMRQQDDTVFAQLLNRVRKGLQTPEDMTLLQTRVIQANDELIPCETTHIYTYNRLVDQHNQMILADLPGPVYMFEAVDARKDTQTGRICEVTFPHMAGGLPTQVQVALNAKVMLTKNIDVSDGLVNSAAGVVAGFVPPPDGTSAYKPKYILVKFNDSRVGSSARTSSSAILPDANLTPIAAVEAQVPIRKQSKVTGKRTQFPLALAWAVTIHKEQGKTEDALVLSCEGRFQPGQFYTAVSRTKTLDGLHILGPLPQTFPVNKKSLAEMDRMHKDARFQCSPSLCVMCDMSSHLKLVFLNINSLKPHQQSLMRETMITTAHVVCLAETWLIPHDDTPLMAGYHTVRQDSPASRRRHRQGGLLMFLHPDLQEICQFPVALEGLEHISVLCSFTADPTRRVGLCVVYKKPTINMQTFLTSLEQLIVSTPLHTVPLLICGDFNVDLLSGQPSADQLKALMRSHQLHQYVQSPTQQQGGLLDHLYASLHSDDVLVDVTAVHYSDHCLITAAIPFHLLK